MHIINQMTQKSELGREGEEFASKYLLGKKYKIIERNFRAPWGELDIIARARDKTLVFVEVKTIRGFYPGGIQPEDQMTSAKIKKFKRAAALYVGHRQDLIDDKKGWRLDAICLTKIGNDFLVKYYENAG